MIHVPFPHMALNANNVTGTKYKMWNTWEVSNGESVDQMLNWIAKVAASAPGGKLETLILKVICWSISKANVGSRRIFKRKPA